jgi:hypothetical protein
MTDIQAVIDRTRGRLDAYSPDGGDAYQARMNRLADAWKGQTDLEPIDRVPEMLNAKLDQLQADLNSAANAGETAEGYLAMLEERADSLAEEVDTFIEAKRARAANDSQTDPYQARMDRLGSAWKDSDEETEKEKQAKSRKRLDEEQKAREFKPVFSGDAQSTLDAAFQAKQQRTANAWKDGHQTNQAPTAAPDLRFGCK